MSRRRKAVLAGLGTLVLAGSALATAVVPANASPTSQAAPRVSSTTVKWRFADRLCVDDGSQLVRAWSCNGTAAQAWAGVDTVFANSHELVPVTHTTWCVVETARTNWAKVKLIGGCRATPAESWRIVPRLGGYELINGYSGKCLQDGNNAAKAILTIYTCNGSYSQEVSPFSLGTPI